MKSSKFVKAQTIWYFLKVRIIRNECRHFLTNNTNHISVLKQVKFWVDVSNGNNIEVYYFEVDGNVIGYGLIRIDGKKRWITGGIRTAYRGLGFGRHLFQKLIDISLPNEVWLEVMDWNTNALALYRSLKFKKAGKRGEHIIIMKKK